MLIGLIYIALVEFMGGYIADRVTVGNPNEWRADIVETRDPFLRWDALKYVQIASEGYVQKPGGEVPLATFYPLYSVVLSHVSALLPWELAVVGKWLSRGFLLVLIILLLRLAELGLERVSPYRMVIALLAFPTAFIMCAPYSEAMFLCALVFVFLCIEESRYRLAFLGAVILGLTRFPALYVVPALLASVYMRGAWGRWRSYLPAAGVVVGHLVPYVYFAWRFGDPFLAHTTAREVFERSMTWPWNAVLANLMRVYVAWQIDHYMFWTELGNALGLVFFPSVAIYFLWRRRWDCGLLCAGLIGLFLCSGKVESSLRYQLTLFPAFMMLGTLPIGRILFGGIVALFASYQVFLLFLYVQYLSPPI